jgi:hypothetical protein
MRTATVQVKNVRFSTPGSGAIFVGMVLDDRHAQTGEMLSVRCPAAVMGGLVAQAGDVWRVDGSMESYRGAPQLRAASAILVRP